MKLSELESLKSNFPFFKAYLTSDFVFVFFLHKFLFHFMTISHKIVIRPQLFNNWCPPRVHAHSKQTRSYEAGGLLKHARPSNGHQSLKDKEL